MYKYILILLFLFFPIISQTPPTTYAPMSVRTFDLDIEDICSYQKSANDFKYVEPCERDYKCEEDAFTGLVSGTIGICRKNNQVQTPFGSACEEDTDCNSDYTGLKCENKICVIDENEVAIDIDGTQCCPNNKLFPLFDSGIGKYKCTKIEGNEETKKLCKSGSTRDDKAYPDYMKVCGEIELNADNNDYIKASINSIGSVSDGKFVEDLLACKSGFALNFYSDGETTSTPPGADNYPKCVEYNGVEYKKDDSCKIKYILDKKVYYYDTGKVDGILFGNNAQTFCNNFKFIDTKLDLFRQYVNKVTQLGNECSNIKYYDEPYTCKNDELRKLYYFYNNIEEYMLYKNEDEITEFILQKVYPSYGVKYSKDDASKYLSNKFICLLILLLL